MTATQPPIRLPLAISQGGLGNSTGDASGLSVTENASGAAGTLAQTLALKASVTALKAVSDASQNLAVNILDAVTTDIATAQAASVSTASADASTKAAAAQVAAISAAATDASTKASAAQSAAISAAAIDATTKAGAAQSAAVSAAATDASTKASNAQAAAVSAAATDATTKANAAQSNAASDATTKANAAQAAAVAAAASDATTKASAAQTAALAAVSTGVGVDIRASETSIASAATVDLGLIGTVKALITGTNTINSFGSLAHGLRFIRFDGSLTLTHNAASLILPTKANIVTAADDTCIATSDGSGNWRVRNYQRADGTALATGVPSGVWRVLAASGVAVSMTGSTTETALVTVPLPAGLLGANGVLRITTSWTHTNNANVKNIRIRLGGASGPIVGGFVATSFARTSGLTQIWNRNSQSSQTTLANNGSIQPYSQSAAVPFTAAVDTSVAQTIQFGAQLATATDTMTLESYVVEYFYAP